MSTICVLAGGVYLRVRAMRALVIGGCFAMVLQASEWGAKQDLARAAMTQHNYNAAAQLFDESVAVASSDSERNASLAARGIALNRADRNREARPLLEQAMATGTDKFTVAGVLASVDRSLGDYQSAERILRYAIQDAAENATNRATLMVNLADLLREESRSSEADKIMNEASRIPDLPRQLRISILVECAELNREMQRWTESIADWDKVGELARDEHSLQLEETYTGGLGETWFAAGDVTRADPLLRRSLTLLRKDPSASTTQIAMALALMASVYITENKLALAAESLEEAITRDEASMGPSHPQMAMLLELRAAISSRRGEVQDARDDLDRARNIMTTHFGAESTAVAGVDAALGDVEQQAHRPAAAAAQYSVALRLLKNAGAEGARFGALVLTRYTAALKAARGDDAKTVLGFADGK